MKNKLYLFVCLLFALSNKVQSAAPTWTVTPGSFQYNMTMVAVANINCVDLQSATNRIGVFVSGQCRGTAYTSQVVNGKYTASLFIYSNIAQGESLTFKVYDAGQDSVYTLSNTITFQQNASFGTSNVPYQLKNNNAPTSIALSGLNLNENIGSNASVATISATDPDVGDVFTYTLVSGEGATDNAKFALSSNTLLVQTAFNYEAQTTASIRLRATDIHGCWVENSFTIAINNVNEAPFELNLNDSVINENTASNTIFASLSASDPDANENLIFSLATGLGDSNNASFMVVGNTLRSAQSFNYETKSSYGIRLKVRDGGNLSYERAVVILIRDVNDAPSNLLINGSPTSASFAENRGLGTFVANLSTVDEDANSVFNYSFVGTGGNDNASFQIVGNQLRSNIAFDYETRQTYSVFIQSSDGLGGTIAKQFLLNVTDSNDAPTALALSNTGFSENLPIGTFVAKLSTSDPDANQTNFTYNLVSGAGSGGNANFTISNDSLFSNAIFNYESAATYSIRIKTTDAFNASFQQTFTINILDANDAPTDISLSNNLVNENSVIGTTIGSFGSSDQDANNTFVYSLVAGTGATDNASFSILGSNLRSASSLDYEAKSSYSIRVKTNDGNGGVFEKVFTISVNDINDLPSNILLSNSSISENREANALVGYLTTTDQDASNTFTYSFDAVTGNDNANFVLTGNSLKTATSLNFESKAAYFVYILTNDGNGGTFSKQFQITVVDSNDAPSDLALSSPTISENQSINSYIGTIIPTDQDPSGTYVYSLVSGTGSTDNSSFFVRNDSLFTAVALDFEVKNTYLIRVRVNNSGLLFEKSFTIRVTNDNDAPTDIQLSNAFLNENMVASTLIGYLSSTDPDTGNVFTYSLVPGIGSTNNQQFIIVGNQLRSNTSFNYEQQKTCSIRVQTNDGNGGTFSKVLQINLVDVNDVPTQITLSNASIKENLPANSLVASLTTTDEDSASTHTYSFINSSTNDNGKFILSGNQLRTNSVFDYETKANYVIQIQTNDGNGGTFDKQFIIAVLDSNDAPIGISLNNLGIEENLPSNTFIGNFTTIDNDQSGTYSYSLVSGAGSNGNASFVIRNDSLFSNAIFDFEMAPSKSIRVRTIDNGGLLFDQIFVLNIIDNNDAPTALLLTNNSLSENLPSRSNIGYFSTTDQDAASSFSYSLVSGIGSTDNANFNINGNELRSNAKFNYENKSSYSIRVSTNDGRGGIFEQAFTISILDSNDAPTGLTLSNDNISENRQSGALVGLLSAQDEDASDNFTYSFYDGASNNNNQFLLVNNQVRSAQSFNYEDKNFFIIYVRVQDNLGLNLVKQFVINILDSNDAPTDVQMSNLAIAENAGSSAFLGTLTATDADQFTGFAYSLVGGAGGTDNASFKISNDTIYATTSFNYELKSLYSLRVRATDNFGAFSEKAFSISITNENDAPNDITLSNSDLAENEALGTEIGILNGSDEDANETFEFAFVAGTGDADNASFKLIGNKLVSNVIADYETKNNYTIRLLVSDKLAANNEKSFLIQIKNVSEKPTLMPDTFFVSESAAIGTLVGTVHAITPDIGSTLVYQIDAQQSVPFKIGASTGEIAVAQALDYETTKEYQLLVKVSDANDASLSSSAFITIRIGDEIETKQKLPVNNVMSPDGDGMNDAFVIDNIEMYQDYSLSIYNNNGLVVYQVLGNYQNNWEGTFEGSPLPTGVYFYVFSNKANEFKGSINIIR
jgi:gliding motility-associated-like protein